MKFTPLITLVAASPLILQEIKQATTPASALTKGPAAVSSFPTSLGHVDLVKDLKSSASPQLLKNYVVALTEFPDRYYQSENGVKAAVWIRDQIAELIPQVSPEAVLTVRFYNHTFMQPSVIARYEAKNPAPGSPSDLVITGSHFDTMAQGSPDGDGGPNPAADDCASGTGVVHEALRTLVTKKFIPKRPIEFHMYAAEEEGLYGSNAIAESYARAKTLVFAYLNLDQSGYVAPRLTKPQIGIFTDYTTKGATDFARLTVNEYTSVKTGGSVSVDSRCGYQCTDNAAWAQRGYNAALVFEGSSQNASPNNDRVKPDGSPLDTLETINWTHLQDFVHHTIGYIVELSLAK